MLSRTAQYAFRAVLLLALEPNVNHGAAEIARRIDAPPNYTGKLLKSLSDSGILRSTRGLGGGFQLARPARKIRLLDVVEPIDKVSRWTTCFLGLGACQSDRPCPIHAIWLPIREQYLTFLKTKTVADLPADPKIFGEYLTAFSRALVSGAAGKRRDETGRRKGKR